jgi:DUF4097 and DUF4098 domain-containing protein YvlB
MSTMSSVSRKGLYGLILFLVPAIHCAQDSDWPEKDEFQQSYTLAPGSQVEIKAINGSVTIETTSGSTAEVHVIRSARKREDLEYRKVVVEQVGSRFTVRGENDSEGRRHADVRQQIMLKLPRKVDLEVHGINGSVKAAEIEGRGSVSGVNGRVELTQVGGINKISGINGSVSVSVARLEQEGMKISGVNGRVDVQFAENLNAEIHASGINGKVETDLPATSLLSEWSRSNFKAKVGSGGPIISVSGVNGKVALKKRSGSEARSELRSLPLQKHVKRSAAAVPQAG